VPESLAGESPPRKDLTPDLSEKDWENIHNATEDEMEHWGDMFKFLVQVVLPKTPIDVRESYSSGYWQFDICDGVLGYRFFDDAPKEGVKRVMYYFDEALKATENRWFEVEGYEALDA